MGKKSKRVRASKQSGEDSSRGGRAPPAHRKEEEETIENLRFEDPYVDEIVEEDEDVMEEEETDMDDAITDKDPPQEDVELVQSWHPLMGGTPPDEPLEMDPSAYKMYHTLSPEWPVLSFDFLKDSLGDARQRFPHSLQVAIGTQADTPENNKLTVIKLSDLSKLPQDDDEEDVLNDDDDKDDDGSSSSDEEDLDLDPVMEHYSIPHYGGVNRLRAMPQSSDVVATWSDAGTVNVYNIAHLRARFASSEGRGVPTSSSTQGSNKPVFSYSGHGDEGFALDWSLVNRGHLATGDNHGAIHLWKPRNDGSYEVAPSYESSGGNTSVEEIQWSPSESTVFCAAESGGYLSIYDTRAPNRSMLRHLCHNSKADVNVASWNRHVSNLLATGGDDGTLSVWDLRQFSPKADKPAPPLARFSCHKTPITSVEWHPTDESMLATSDTVGAYIYDLSVEEDTSAPSSTVVADIPPQLLFCHSGSQDFKELHWHPQISSCVMTTAYSGFSVFIPSNL